MNDFENNNEICSIHFRIGDYKTIEDAHPILKLDYYKNSIKYMLENNNTIKYIENPDALYCSLVKYWNIK